MNINLVILGALIISGGVLNIGELFTGAPVPNYVRSGEQTIRPTIEIKQEGNKLVNHVTLDFLEGSHLDKEKYWINIRTGYVTDSDAGALACENIKLHQSGLPSFPEKRMKLYYNYGKSLQFDFKQTIVDSIELEQDQTILSCVWVYEIDKKATTNLWNIDENSQNYLFRGGAEGHGMTKFHKEATDVFKIEGNPSKKVVVENGNGEPEVEEVVEDFKITAYTCEDKSNQCDDLGEAQIKRANGEYVVKGTGFGLAPDGEKLQFTAVSTNKGEFVLWKCIEVCDGETSDKPAFQRTPKGDESWVAEFREVATASLSFIIVEGSNLGSVPSDIGEAQIGSSETVTVTAKPEYTEGDTLFVNVITAIEVSTDATYYSNIEIPQDERCVDGGGDVCGSTIVAFNQDITGHHVVRVKFGTFALGTGNPDDNLEGVCEGDSCVTPPPPKKSGLSIPLSQTQTVLLGVAVLVAGMFDILKFARGRKF